MGHNHSCWSVYIENRNLDTISVQPLQSPNNFSDVNDAKTIPQASLNFYDYYILLVRPQNILKVRFPEIEESNCVVY